MNIPPDGSRPEIWSRVVITAVVEEPRLNMDIAYWRAVHDGSANPLAPLAEYEGSLESAIAWARARHPDEVLVWDPDVQDLVAIKLS